jgi:hypothetical protein
MTTQAPLNFGSQLHDPGVDSRAVTKAFDDVFEPPKLTDRERAAARRAGRNNMKPGPPKRSKL